MGPLNPLLDMIATLLADLGARLFGGTRRERTRILMGGQTFPMTSLQDAVLDPRVRCPHCANMVEPDGMICPLCLRDLPPGWQQKA